MKFIKDKEFRFSGAVPDLTRGEIVEITSEEDRMQQPIGETLEDAET